MVAPELCWLPKILDWEDGFRVVGAPGGSAEWDALVALANARIDSLQTLRLDRKLVQLFGSGSPPEVPRLRLAVLASSTVEHLIPALRVALLRRGVWLETYACGFGQYAQELLDTGSALHAFRPDTLLFALDARHLIPEWGPVVEAEQADQQLEALCDRIGRNWRLARAAFGCTPIQQTLLPVFPSALGGNEHRLPGSRPRLVDRLNARLRDMAEAEGADLLAVDTRAARDGLRAWHDPALWHHAKQEVHPAAAPVYGDLLGRLLGARQGRSFKALVLDLDNTLWGGVIGDDGLDGIALGPGSALGEAHAAFQRYARALSQRGVILAVCSKNDEARALEPFDKHPEMVLRRADIAGFAVNWTDKAANIREIAGRLNIGWDAIVFADDNPFERNIVRRELPMVAVPELPDDPSLYADCIADAGYFEAVRLTQEDLQRPSQYQANLRRESSRIGQASAPATDLDGYLASLEMEASWSRFDARGLPRITQLINKTNQFNLTTRRSSEEALTALASDPRALTLQLRLRDRFGDNGMIAVVIGRFETATTDILIDTWLMSCRVLGRGVERVTLNLAVAQARRLGAHRLVGEYRPSARNDMVREHYAQLGFTKLAELAGGVTRWALRLDDFEDLPAAIHTAEAA